MQVLIQGADGRMGRLYAAIVRHLGHEDIPYDIKSVPWGTQPHLPGTHHEIVEGPLYSPDFSAADAVIIATNPESHYELCCKALQAGKPTLVEKPVSKTPGEVEALVSLSKRLNVPLYMVNNWAFATESRPRSCSRIHIANYFTGADGVWDLIQPLHLLQVTGKLTIDNTAPVPSYEVDTRTYNTVHFQKSYVEMVHTFLSSVTAEEYAANLWPVDDNLLELHRRMTTLTYEQFSQK
jgi:hypothetical protein